MNVDVLLLCDREFDNFKVLIENLDRYLEPLIEFDANITLHFDYDIDLREDIIQYSHTRNFNFKVNTQSARLHEQSPPSKIIEAYDCALLFVDVYSSKIRDLIDMMRQYDFNFRIVNYLKLGSK